MNMKKKIVIFLILIIIMILGIVIFFSINSTDNIDKKGEQLFGKSYCPKKSNDYRYEDYEHPMIAGMALTDYKCKLCNKKYTHPNTATPKICSACATATNRCQYCGKLKNEI